MSTDHETGEVEYQDEHPDLSEVNEVWIGSESVAGEEFVAALNAVQDFQKAIREVKDDLDEMNVGLDRDDAIALIYARNYDLQKGTVKKAFEVIDAFVEEDIEDVAPRIIADHGGTDITITEAAQVWDEIVTLAQKYGTMNDDTTENDND